MSKVGLYGKEIIGIVKKVNDFLGLENDFIIAGGQVQNHIGENLEYRERVEMLYNNDVDVFFSFDISKYSDDILKKFEKEKSIKTDDFVLTLLTDTPNAFTLNYKVRTSESSSSLIESLDSGVAIQLIIPCYGTFDEIMDEFDLNASKCAWDIDGNLLLSDDYENVAKVTDERYMKVETLIRAVKYITMKNTRVDRDTLMQLFKIAINTKDEVFKQQFMYGGVDTQVIDMTITEVIINSLSKLRYFSQSELCKQKNEVLSIIHDVWLMLVDSYEDIHELIQVLVETPTHIVNISNDHYVCVASLLKFQKHNTKRERIETFFDDTFTPETIEKAKNEFPEYFI